MGIRSNQRNFVLYGFIFRNSLAFQYCKSAKQTHWKDTIKYFFLGCRKRSACYLSICSLTDHGLDSPLICMNVTLLISPELLQTPMCNGKWNPALNLCVILAQQIYKSEKLFFIIRYPITQQEIIDL